MPNELKEIFYSFTTAECLVFTAFFVTLLISRFLKRKLYLFALFTLPATFLHELSHYIVSLLTMGRPISFSFIPRKAEDGGLILGSVVSSNSTWYNQGIISIAPLFLFLGAYFILENIGFIMNIVGNKYLTGYLMANIIIGSIPSSTDWRLAFQAPALFICIAGFCCARLASF